MLQSVAFGREAGGVHGRDQSCSAGLTPYPRRSRTNTVAPAIGSQPSRSRPPKQRQPPHNPGGRLEERQRDSGPKSARSGGRAPVAVMTSRRSETSALADARSLNPCESPRTQRQRRRGLSAASFVNRGAGRVCNRPGNSGGRIRTYDLRVMPVATLRSRMHPRDRLGSVGTGSGRSRRRSAQIASVANGFRHYS